MNWAGIIGFIAFFIEIIFGGLIFYGKLTAEKEEKYTKAMWICCIIACVFFVVAMLV